MQKLRLITATAAAVAAALLSPEAAVAGPILHPPVSLVGVAGCPSLLECPPLRSGFLEQEKFDNQFLSVAVEAKTSVVGPIAVVQGRIEDLSSQSFGSLAEAEYSYEVAVVPRVPLQVPSVPVVVTGNVGARASTGGAFATATVSVLAAVFQDHLAACAAIPNCINSRAMSLRGFAAPNSPFSIILDARGGAGVGEENATAEFAAFADPVVTIADGLIPGTNINYRDAFAIEVSPGVTQSLGSAEIPEPATYVLLGAGLVALRFARRRNA